MSRTTPGSSSPSSSATATRATTTAPGRSGATSSTCRSRRAGSAVALEEELLPGGEPVLRARDDGQRRGDLDAVAEAEPVGQIGRRERDLDLARRPRVVRSDAVALRDRLLRARLDERTGSRGRHVSRAEAAEAFLHLDGDELGA